jgi:hypothetical protein
LAARNNLPIQNLKSFQVQLYATWKLERACSGARFRARSDPRRAWIE